MLKKSTFQDIEMLLEKDMSLVGEKGVKLSGGQRSRLGLARAIYRDADIYLLDDPLCAVDIKVGKHIFDKCINGFLKDKTRILITHQLQFIHDVDRILILKDVSTTKLLLVPSVNVNIYCLDAGCGPCTPSR